MATAAVNANNARIDEALSHGAAMNPDNPFQDSNDWLEAQVNEVKQRSTEYARMATEESRQQYEAMVRQNILRQQASAQGKNDRLQQFKDGQQVRDQRDETSVTQMFTQLASTAKPGESAWNMPLERLRDVGQTVDKAQRFLTPEQMAAVNHGLDPYSHPLDATQQLVNQATREARHHAGPFPDGKWAHVTNNDDGTMRVDIPTGEVYKGDLETVLQMAGKSLVHTKRWAEGFRDVAQRTTAQQQMQPQQSPEALNQISDNSASVSSLADYWAAQQSEALARRYGFSNEQEMVQHFSNIAQMGEEWQNQMKASAFLTACPDFPNTEAACDAIAQIVTDQGWQYTPESMEAAHHLAVKHGMYQALPPEAQEAATGRPIPIARPVAPPMISSQSPDANQQGWNPWDTQQVSLDQLRKAAIRQELEGGKR